MYGGRRSKSEASATKFQLYSLRCVCVMSFLRPGGSRVHLLSRFWRRLLHFEYKTVCACLRRPSSLFLAIINRCVILETRFIRLLGTSARLIYEVYIQQLCTIAGHIQTCICYAAHKLIFMPGGKKELEELSLAYNKEMTTLLLYVDVGILMSTRRIDLQIVYSFFRAYIIAQ